jgi:hypothetical protein
MLSIMEFVSCRVTANFPWPKAVRCFQILRLNVLIIGRAFLLILVIVVRIGIGPWHFEYLVFWAGLLNAGSSPFGKICFICVKQIAKSNFEFLIHFFFF